MKSRIKFRINAYSDAAGKFNPDAVRNGNEDNFYVDDNLCGDVTSNFQADVVKDMGPLGIILAVADGMGGMNAGEVASEIAVNTIQDFFSPEHVTSEKAANHQSRKKYLEKLIVTADARIKSDSAANSEHEGMGSTIILAWIVGNELTLSWCGDSRAYRYNPSFGLQMISEDHSYVQELVKQGVLTYEQTFEHPQGNIVTRSLGDESHRAEPETRFFNVYDGDIILLCSDGLSGVLRDRLTPDGRGGYFPGENIEDIIRQNSSSLQQCREVLFAAAERADWYDNVTVILCEICSGAGPSPALPEPVESKNFWNKSLIHLTPKHLITTVIVVLIIVLGLLAGGFLGYHFAKQDVVVKDTVVIEQKADTTKEQQPVVQQEQPKKTTPKKAVAKQPKKVKAEPKEEPKPEVENELTEVVDENLSEVK